MRLPQPLVNKEFFHRFEPDGDDYLFRRKLTAPGYRVAAAERDRMVAQFNRRFTWLSLMGPILLLLVLAAATRVFGRYGAGWQKLAILATFAIWLGLYGVLFYRIWSAPVRAVRGQAPVDQGRSKMHAQRLALIRLTWGQLAGAAIAVPVMLLTVGAKVNLLVGWNRLWLVLAAALAAGIAVQAVQKLLVRTKSR
jgi:hypothetical protein